MDGLRGPVVETVWPRRLYEAVLTAGGGGALAWLVGLPFGVEWVTAAAGAVNGWLSGWRWMYDWRAPRGWAALVLDSTWGLIGVTGGLLLHVVNLAWYRLRSGYRADLTYRQNHHVYSAGLSLKRGYAFAVGNVISGAAGSIDFDDEAGSARRRQFIKRHEALHVWQNRWFGPLYQIGYLGWLVGGAIVGAVVAVIRRDDLKSVVETLAYFNNPFEYWAYRNDEYWPPRDAHPTYVWGSTRATVE